MLILENNKQKKDVFSTQFEKEVSSDERHEKGQYFTHKEIVDFIINQIPFKEEYKILDPTCGAGAFLGKVKKKGIKSNNIYGSDIDPRALKLCGKNLNQTKNLILGDFINKELFEENFFNIIIGNPPFQNLSKKDKKFPSKHKHFLPIQKGTTNSASLVLIRSYFLLKENGYIGFVLPKNFIRVDSFKEIRKFLLENMQILLIKDLDHHFKDVRCDQIILIAQKKKPNLDKKVKIIPYKKSNSFLNQMEYKLSQKEFFNYPFFPLFYNEQVKSIADKLLSNKISLSNEAEIFRGESIGLFKKNILTEPIKDSLHLLRGNSIERFGIKKILYLKKDFVEQLTKTKIKRLLRNKIVIQNISSKEGGIFSVLSYKNELTMDTVTNIIPHKKEYLAFFNSLIGSRLCNFIMIHIVYLNSNFSIHTDKTYIGQLPVIYPNNNTKIKIESINKKLLTIKDKYSEEFKEEYSKLNKLIYSLYNLNNEEIKIIEKSLKEVMSKKNG